MDKRVARAGQDPAAMPFGEDARNLNSNRALGFVLKRISKTLVCSVLLLSLVGIANVSAQGLLGRNPLQGESAEGEVDALSLSEMAVRSAAITGAIAASEAERGSGDAASADYLDKVLLRQRQIADLLEKQSEVASSRPSDDVQGGGQGRDAAPLAPSVFALNQLLARQIENQGGGELADRRAALATAKAALDQAARARRKARREWEESDEAAKQEAEKAFELERLDAQIAEERVHLRTLKVREAQQKGEAAGDDSSAASKIAEMRAQIKAGAGNSREGFAKLTEREGHRRRDREATERRLATAELQLDAAQKRFVRGSAPSAELLAEVESLTARRDAIRQEIGLFDAQLERLAGQRRIWREWESLLGGLAKKEDLLRWLDEANQHVEQLNDDGIRRAGRVSDLEKRLAKLDDRMLEAGSEVRGSSVLAEQREALSRLEAAFRIESQELATERQMTEHFISDLRGEVAVADPFEYLSRASTTVQSFWDYEISTVDDEPITVGSIALALIFFGIGLWVARRGSAFVGRIALERFKLDAGGSNALQTLSFYFLLVSFMLMALRAVHFPLTAFTVLGGAAAIGIGFGSQNVMNNFISGLILMLERPVRARDVVEVDGNHGVIEQIGARSTQIRSTDGRHIVVPNSFFLESNVVNWTLSDELIRGKVSVGVVYGSPTRLVEKLIRQVVDEEPKALKKPEPIVLFSEFGDNSLNFDVFFWVKARSPMDFMKVQSIIRFRIDDLFREHDLVIAFPQRDVHLDSLSPIEVRMVGAAKDSGAKEK